MIRLLPHGYRPSSVSVSVWLVMVFCVVSCTGVVHAQENIDGESTQGVSFLWWLIQVSGAMGAVILAISVYFVAIVVRAFLDIRISNAVPQESVELVDQMISQRNLKEIVTFVQQEDSTYATILAAGVAELKYGIDEARDKIERRADALTAAMERSISDLAVIGSLGPLIGLLGTLKGMISSFSVIAMSGVALDPGKVAEGISEALVLTFEGVMISVPAIYCYSLFRNRISKINIEGVSIADDQIRSISRMIRINPTQDAST